MKPLPISKVVTALRHTTILSVILLVITNVGWSYWHLTRAEAKFNQPAYVITHDATYPLLKIDQPTTFEANNHVERFMELMFAHDAESFESHIERALHLIDREEGLHIHQSFKDNQVHDLYVKFNSRSFFNVEDISIDMSREPYVGTVQGVQTIEYQQESKESPIAASFEVSRTRRSQMNPFGLLLQNWKFIPYQKETSWEDS